MRSIWKGTVSFGLVTIPVRLYSATEEHDVSFHQVHRDDGGRIRYRRVCQVCGQEVSYADIARGFELPGGDVVMLTDEDFADLPLPTSRTIEVLQFVPLAEVDPIYFARSYYLEPEGAGTRPYVLLRDALEASGQVAVVKVALRQRESLAALRVRDGVFVLELMLWPDEIRTADFAFLDEQVEVRPQELAMAGSLISTLSGTFDPAAYTDDYREALQAVIDAKVAGREVVTPPAAEGEPGAVVDLMAALRASVDAARRSRPDAGGGAATAASDGSPADSAPSTARAAGRARRSPDGRGARPAAEVDKPSRRRAAKPAAAGQRDGRAEPAAAGKRGKATRRSA